MGPQKNHTSRTTAFLRRFAKDTEGAVLVEFAIVLPIFLLILMGIVGWGYSISLNDAMFDAARQAAREITVNESNEQEAAQSALAALSIWPTNFTVVAQDTTSTGSEDVRIVITNNNVFATLLPFVPLPNVLRAEVIMRKEPI